MPFIRVIYLKKTTGVFTTTALLQGLQRLQISKLETHQVVQTLLEKNFIIN